MTADQYLHGILLREAVDAGPNSPLLGVQTTLMPTLRQWAGDNLLGVYPSGSFMKGTAVRSGTDIDLFLSLSEHTSETLKEVYNKLFDCLTSAGYSPKRQNVSLNITVPRSHLIMSQVGKTAVTSGAKAPISAALNGTAESRAPSNLSGAPSNLSLVPQVRPFFGLALRLRSGAGSGVSALRPSRVQVSVQTMDARCTRPPAITAKGHKVRLSGFVVASQTVGHKPNLVPYVCNFP